MARLNTRPSNIPSANVRRPLAISHTQSDQENIDPSAAARGKVTPRSGMEQPSQATAHDTAATDGEQHGSAARKRRRLTNDTGAGPAGPADSQDDDDDHARFTKYFDPYQDPIERRDIRKRTRELTRVVHERRDELLQAPGDELAKTVEEADELYTEVKQTDNATLDSRLLVDVSDLAYKKSAALVLDDHSTGIDVDDFLSKVISFMRNHGPDRTGSTSQQHQQQPPPQTTQTQSRAAYEGDGDDELLDTVPLDWAFLGRHACYPHNARPAVRSFLLGPLSREKKQRQQTQRRARNARDLHAREAKPQELTNDDLTQSDQNSLTSQCAEIRRLLKAHCKVAVRTIRASGITDAELSTPEGQALMDEHQVDFVGGKLGVPLLRYVINPNSFGQTVENIFYVSFLIKEGSAGIVYGDNGLPVLFNEKPRSVDEQRANNISKHQAIVSIDYESWRKLIDIYNIKEPMIPHREQEQTQLGARGWYG